jgi:hypothetical protein
MTNNLCNQDPTTFEGCGSFCGLLPALDKVGKTLPSDAKTIKSWRQVLQKKGNAPDSAFKGKKWYFYKGSKDSFANTFLGYFPRYLKKDLGVNVAQKVDIG